MADRISVLFLCTSNACRSRMAEGAFHLDSSAVPGDEFVDEGQSQSRACRSGSGGVGGTAELLEKALPVLRWYPDSLVADGDFHPAGLDGEGDFHFRAVTGRVLYAVVSTFYAALRRPTWVR